MRTREEIRKDYTTSLASPYLELGIQNLLNLETLLDIRQLLARFVRMYADNDPDLDRIAFPPTDSLAKTGEQ